MSWKLSYYHQKRLTDFSINTVMTIFLVLSLFPIVWMVFNSFKDNTEILSGRLGLNRASNDVIFLQQDEDALWVGSADGGLVQIDGSSGKHMFQKSFATTATSFASDDKSIWVASSDRGLRQISKKRPGQSRGYPLEIAGLDITRISSSSLTADNEHLWLAFEQKGITDIFEISKGSAGVIRRIPVPGLLGPVQVVTKDSDGPNLWVGGDNIVFQLELPSGKLLSRTQAKGGGSRIFQIVPTEKGVYVGTDDGLLMIPQYSHRSEMNSVLPADEEKIRVMAIQNHDHTLFLGTNRGLIKYDIAHKTTHTVENIFPSLSNKQETGWFPGEVLSLAVGARGTYLGGTQGRASFLSHESDIPIQATRVSQGHLMFRWRNYVDLWRNIDFGTYLRNSLVICGITMLIAMVLATLAAYALARFPFPGSKFFSMTILATQMIPAIMYLIPIFSMFVKFTELTGIPVKGTFPGIILIYSAFFVPFSIWILRGFFAAIPKELEESARIDGCSPFQVFWHIVLPLAVPGIIATGIYVFLTAWDELMFAWVLTDSHTMTIPVGIRLFVGNYQNRFDLMMAAATVATIPVIILFFLLQRHIVKGLTAGAIKE